MSTGDSQAGYRVYCGALGLRPSAWCGVSALSLSQAQQTPAWVHQDEGLCKPGEDDAQPPSPSPSPSPQRQPAITTTRLASDAPPAITFGNTSITRTRLAS